MAVYLDTSATVPLFFNESASTPTLARIAREHEIWLSRWTLAEFSSAAAFKIRVRQTSEATAAAALSLLRAKLARGDFRLAELERGRPRRNRPVMRSTCLRTAYAGRPARGDCLAPAAAARYMRQGAGRRLRLSCHRPRIYRHAMMAIRGGWPTASDSLIGPDVRIIPYQHHER